LEDFNVFHDLGPPKNGVIDKLIISLVDEIPDLSKSHFYEIAYLHQQSASKMQISTKKWRGLRARDARRTPQLATREGALPLQAPSRAMQNFVAEL
jgi:hypothetical protein